VVAAALVAAAGVVLGGPGAAGAAPPGVQAGASGAAGERVVTVSCGDAGNLDLVLRPGAPPAPAAALPAGTRLVIAYRVVDARTGAVFVGGSRAATPCGDVTVGSVPFAAIAAGAPPAGVRASDRLTGTLSISLATTEPSVAASAAVPGAGEAFPFAAALRSYLATRSGRVSVAVFSAPDGRTYSYAPERSFVTASIVKVAILGTLLRQAQAADRALTSSERSLATRMIERSDNAAASTLWNQVGRGPGVGAFMGKVGMPSTTPGSGGFWGLTTTNTPDQVRLVRDIAYGNTVLDDDRRGYLESLMENVVASQAWGVSGGVPAGATVALKNGWLPRTGGWVINSIGHVHGSARDYVIAVLSSGNPSMSYGIDTVEHVSSLVWNRLPPPGADLYGALPSAGASRTVEVHALSASSRYAAFLLHRTSAFGVVDPDDWVFAVGPSRGDGRPDLVGVHLRNTASRRVEVHVASAVSNYRTFSRHTATALSELAPGHWQVLVGNAAGGSADLVAVTTDATGSGRVEVHILSESSSYGSFSAHAVTALPAGPAMAQEWQFLLGGGGDLVGVAHTTTGSGRTEVHTLSRASHYARFTLQAATALAYTDEQWSFAFGDQNGDGAGDLFAVRTSGGASGKVEVHVLSGVARFGTFLVHAATPILATSAPWQWSAFVPG
jgi:beta-lactamase class A